MNKALKFLRSREWTMGNGQCPDCCGSRPHIGWWTDTVGHKRTCPSAQAIQELGGKVQWERKNHSRSVTATKKFFRELAK